MKRITSLELVEVRTVLSRARTALATIDENATFRVHGGEWEKKYYATLHTDHEISLMRSALMSSIYVLNQIEKATGYKDGET